MTIAKRLLADALGAANLSCPAAVVRGDARCSHRDELSNAAAQHSPLPASSPRPAYRGTRSHACMPRGQQHRVAMQPHPVELQVEHVKAEKDALSIVQSPFIVTLFYSFQDDDYLYFIMEYLPGGDVMTLLIRKDILSEEEVRFYVAETVLALEAIHNAGYLHRCALQTHTHIDQTPSLCTPACAGKHSRAHCKCLTTRT